MIKKIPIAELKRGMYVHDVNCSWRVEPIRSFRLRIDDDARIDDIRELGVREVYIDTVLGDDLPGAPTEDEVRQALEDEMIRVGTCGEVPVHHRLIDCDEIRKAVAVHDSAGKLVHSMMSDVRLGRQIESERVGEALQSVTGTVLGNVGALVQLGRLRTKDDYTFQHSVGVCALLTAFGKVLDFNRQALHDIGVGALLHDIGKMRVPPEILNKPQRLTDGEFDQIKLHVDHGVDIVADAPWVGKTALNVLAHHHERFDGTGYPKRLKGTDISYVGQMAAIVDVYDAITAERVYHRQMMPVEALRKLQEWSRFHFNDELVAHFIRSVGIYPVRTVVRLESGRVGIVVEQNPDDLVRPVILTVHDADKRCVHEPYRLDLAHGAQDRIVGYEAPEKFGLDVDAILLETETL